MRNELLAVESGGNGASGQMLGMIFTFFVNSGEHDFFIKRLKNMALAYTPSQTGPKNTNSSLNFYSDQPFEETQKTDLGTLMGTTQPDIDYSSPEPNSGMMAAGKELTVKRHHLLRDLVKKVKRRMSTIKKRTRKM